MPSSRQVPIMRIAWPCLFSASLLLATDYHVDGLAGDDGRAGTTPALAWRTLARADRVVLKPGDRLLLAGGQVFTGTLHLGRQDSGSKDHPVTVASYGTGRAAIAAGTGSGVVLDQCAWVVVSSLIIRGCGRTDGNDGNGVHLKRTTGVVVDEVEASGFRLSGVFANEDVDTRLTRISAHDNGFAGIHAMGWGDHRSRNLYVGHCTADGNPGDPKNLTNHSGNGIVVGGIDGVLIEWCHASNNGWDMPRKGNGPVGIWCWEASKVVIQHCIAHDNKSPGTDGGGFDFDGGVRDSVLQYNLSFNNAGCGYLLCQYPGATAWKDNVVRFNISVNDGAKNMQSGIGLWLGAKGIQDAQIHHNTIINQRHAVHADGDIPGMVYRNNVFVSDGDPLRGDFTGSRFTGNLWWRTAPGNFLSAGKTVYATLAAWAAATGQESVEGKQVGIWADPRLIMPAKGQILPVDPVALATLALFRPMDGSPCLRAGSPVPDAGSCDLSGRPWADGQHPALGALEAAAPRQSPVSP